MRLRTRRLETRLRPAERRARLLEAASRVLRRAGWQDATVRDIVSEAGVSRGTFYLHFESKRRCLGALASAFLDRLLPPPASIPDRLTSRAALEDAIRAIHRSVLEAFRTERATARLLFEEGAASDPLVARALLAHEAAWKRLVVHTLAKARADGVLRDGYELGFAADALIGATQRVARVLVLKEGRADLDGIAAQLASWHVAALT